MRPTIARIVLLLALTGAVSGLMANPPEKPPKGMGKYLVVLWEPGSPVPGKPDERIPRVAEPDIAKLGGRVLGSHGNQRLIFLPLAAITQLRRHQAVGLVQRIWTGEPFAEWDEAEGEAGTRLRGAAIETDAEEFTWERDYEYDAEGNITQIGADTFSYDDVGRLKQMKTSGAVVETYVYDGFGNLIELQKPGMATVTVPVDKSTNRMIGHTYDESGSVTSRNGRGTYEYDPLNMLAAYRTSQADRPRRLLYDANDERIGTLSDSSLERWMMRDFQGQVLREYRADNTFSEPVWIWEQDHIRGEGQLIAGETIKWSYSGAQGEFEYGGIRHYHLDHLGSVRIVTDAAGRAITENDFYPFGKAKSRQYQEQIPWGLFSPFTNGMRFAGHWRDFMGQPGVEDDLYLDYMHARHYDPNLGRFLSVDPGKDWDLHQPQSWNMYSYVRNNPVNATDPTGRFMRLKSLSDIIERFRPEAEQINKAAEAMKQIPVFKVGGRYGPPGGELRAGRFQAGVTVEATVKGDPIKKTVTAELKGMIGGGLPGAERRIGGQAKLVVFGDNKVLPNGFDVPIQSAGQVGAVRANESEVTARFGAGVFGVEAGVSYGKAAEAVGRTLVAVEGVVEKLSDPVGLVFK